MAVAPTEALLSSLHTAVLEAALPAGTVGRRTAQHGTLQEQFGTPQLQMQLSPLELPLQNPSNGQRLVSNHGAGGTSGDFGSLSQLPEEQQPIYVEF